jgi:hypothetical protein
VHGECVGGRREQAVPVEKPDGVVERQVVVEGVQPGEETLDLC